MGKVADRHTLTSPWKNTEKQALMQVAVCQEPGVLELETRDPPKRQPGEALVRILRVGICGTDCHIFEGTQPYLTYPRVMGHELAGTIIECDEDSRFARGTIVCVMPYMFCGYCSACIKGKTNCCARIEVLGVHRDGGLSEYLAVPEDYLLDARGLSLDEAAMVEFLSIGHHAVRRAGSVSGQRVLIVGAGPIGMAVTTFSSICGADVTVLDGNAHRARFCFEQLGAKSWLTPGNDVAARLAEISSGEGFDIVFDATGSAAAMEAGFRYVGHGGTYVLVSIVAADISFSDPEFHKREMSLVGSRNATLADFQAVIEMIRSGAIPTSAMHTHSTSLREFPVALTHWMKTDSGVIKGIVEL